MAWSKWIRGLTHEPRDGWFTRADEAFEALPTRVGGVYLIGVGKDGSDEPERVVYCGRALATEAGGGTSLRARLYSGYAKSGSHLHVKMRKALEEGNDVFFKWRVIADRQEIVDTEAEMIANGAYAWNAARPSKTREFVFAQLDKLVGADAARAQMVKEWLAARHPALPEG